MLERRDRARSALAGRSDRGIQPRVRVAEATELREEVGFDAGRREGGKSSCSEAIAAVTPAVWYAT
ncbi:hypothetical protein ASE14_08875 [Agromyces sp. Root81]|nr:hypothetical protein ASE14_08875 [Agromyces sp. Root81]